MNVYNRICIYIDRFNDKQNKNKDEKEAMLKPLSCE